MTNTNRRGFLKVAGSATAVGVAGISTPFVARAGGAKVVIVGGGVGGGTVANYLHALDPSIQVTLIEANADHYTCFQSNSVLSGFQKPSYIHVTYDALRAKGINVVTDRATVVDSDAKVVKTAGGGSFPYDRCVVAPGVDFKWEAIEGTSAEAAATSIPHAWHAGPQTMLLRKQLEAMDDGGVVGIVAPPNPFRCPPGPYERAALIAHYLKNNKPKSKVVIMDPKPAFSKQALFTQAWQRFYGYGTDNSLIEWRPPSDDGAIASVDPATKTVVTADFEDEITFDVLNVIPPQKAGAIGAASGLTSGGWCPTNHKTMESALVKDVYVIGDADSSPMPKSAYSANSQGKVVAQAIVASLAGKEAGTPAYLNTCYSLGSPDWAFSVAHIYRVDEDSGKMAKVTSATSPMDASAESRLLEVGYAYSWMDNIKVDCWG